MAGHLHEFFNYVKDSDWIGGGSAYSNLEEGEPANVDNSL